MSRLKDKVAVVTGAASGIGRATAELFATEGARVVALDRNPSVETDPPRGAVFAAICDVTAAAKVEDLSRRVVRELGSYDVLVNSAGVVVFGMTADGNDEDWDLAFTVNARGVWNTCRSALHHMLLQRAGVIVNIASGAGLRPMPGLAAYSASKAAVVSITRSIAVEYGDIGIRANCICPGMVDTPMNRTTLESRIATGEDRTAFLAPYALKRIGRPEEIAAVALFLASEDSSFMTGATLAADAGRTLH
mgnify:CR=1 FL=1